MIIIFNIMTINKYIVTYHTLNIHELQYSSNGLAQTPVKEMPDQQTHEFMSQQKANQASIHA